MSMGNDDRKERGEGPNKGSKAAAGEAGNELHGEREEALTPEEQLEEPGSTQGKAKGFTLLEVMVAVAILAMSLTSLLTSQMAAMRQMRYSQQVAAAAFLAEYQLVEIEWLERKEGWQTTDTEYTGTFADQGWEDISYRCVVDFLELPEYNEMLSAKEDAEDAAGAPGSDDNLQDTGEQAFSALGLVWPMVKSAIENSIRKASCTVYWNDGKIEHDLTVQTFWTDPTQLTALPGAGGEATSDDDVDGGDGSTGGGSTGGGGGAGGRPGVSGGGGGGSGIQFGGGRP